VKVLTGTGVRVFVRVRHYNTECTCPLLYIKQFSIYRLYASWITGKCIRRPVYYTATRRTCNTLSKHPQEKRLSVEKSRLNKFRGCCKFPVWRTCRCFATAFDSGRHCWRFWRTKCDDRLNQDVTWPCQQEPNDQNVNINGTLRWVSSYRLVLLSRLYHNEVLQSLTNVSFC
jgi:hypothetical protein